MIATINTQERARRKIHAALNDTRDGARDFVSTLFMSTTEPLRT
jgi:hypothetical protein